MDKQGTRLALHTWSLDTTPLPQTLAAAKAGGWNAVELRRIDFIRSFERGLSNDDVLALVYHMERSGSGGRGFENVAPDCSRKWRRRAPNSLKPSWCAGSAPLRCYNRSR